MRNWHYLHAGKAAGWPGQSAALSVVCSAGAVASDSQMTRSGRLLAWSVLAWTGTEGRQEQTAAASGVTRDSFWQWLHSKLAKGKRLWLWQLHATYGMAALGLWEHLTTQDWRLCGGDARSRSNGDGEQASRASGLCVVSDPPTILLAQPARGGGSCQWLDLRNLAPAIDWRGIAGDTGNVACAFQADDERRTAREVAGERARALALWLEGWYDVVRELRLGGLRATAAAQAWQGWRHSYLTCPVEVHTDDARIASERAAIYGGRNECYRVGTAIAGVYEVDATAQYPAIAAAGALPGRLARGLNTAGHTAAEIAGAGYCVIARGWLRTDTPCLPYRLDGRTVYPTGLWHGTYCWPEWQLLERSGGQSLLEQFWAYEPCDPFAACMKALWAARQKAKAAGKGAQQSAIKLLMNSLVGKCAAIGRYWQDCPDQFWPIPWDAWPEYDVATDTLSRYRCLGWRVQREVEEGEAPESIPALAAWIYSVGRVRLWDWMSIACRENVFYCDTDSLWTNEQGYGNLQVAGQIGSGGMGQLRLERVHPWARFYGHKHYETPQGVVCAGLPRNAVLTEDSGWTAWAAATPGQAVRARSPPTTEMIRCEIAARTAYQGGRIGTDGTVYPIEV